jgi:hypothetical protein
MFIKFIDQHRKMHAKCCCNPSVLEVELNGVSSSLNSSSDKNKSLSEFRKIIDRIKESLQSEPDFRWTILISGPDGLTTNMHGFASLFQGMLGGSMVQFEYSERFQIYQFSIEKICNVVNDLVDRGIKPPTCNETTLIDKWAQISQVKVM